MESHESKVIQWLKKNQARGTFLLQKLVQEGSIRGHESRAQAIIIEKCRELKLKLDIWEIGDKELINHPKFCSDRKSFLDNPNVVGLLKGKGGGKSIILNSHIDVVPEGDRTKWREDPFSGLVEHGRLYGRGSSDMKGGTVALLLAIEAIRATKLQLKGDVIFESVIEEESGGAGTLATLLRGYRADGAIIPEPTNLKFFPKQQGSMWFRITVHGKSAHGGTRYEGTSAIEKALLIIQHLQKLETDRNNRINDPLYEHISLPIPINVGKMNGGNWPSSVPDLAVIEGRMGVAPNETMEQAEKEMESNLLALQEIDPWFSLYPPKIEWFGGRWLPGNLPVEHPLVEVITGSYEEITTKEPLIEASPWGTDGGLLSQVGQIPVIIFGPGVTEVAHDANEYINLNDVFMAAEIIALTVLRWCEVAN
ncbi:peptidase [Bacillus sp. 1NLA3E]|uniref:peptidase n=1 Tax=Bacillus sp. 1NLA3E TaxID=666686 RepID=UPI000247F16E|nr:peptidase [Bacillus sp. 1NLA3E]AGK54560.1 acetylornithine deacetylase [Bacillus sp. 1NLA3E]